MKSEKSVLKNLNRGYLTITDVNFIVVCDGKRVTDKVREEGLSVYNNHSRRVVGKNRESVYHEVHYIDPEGRYIIYFYLFREKRISVKIEVDNPYFGNLRICKAILYETVKFFGGDVWKSTKD